MRVGYNGLMSIHPGGIEIVGSVSSRWLPRPVVQSSSHFHIKRVVGIPILRGNNISFN